MWTWQRLSVRCLDVIQIERPSEGWDNAGKTNNEHEKPVVMNDLPEETLIKKIKRKTQI